MAAVVVLLVVVLTIICVFLCVEVVRSRNEHDDAPDQEWRVIREPFYIGFVYRSSRYKADRRPSLLVFFDDDTTTLSKLQDFVDAIGGAYVSTRCERLPFCGGINKALDDASQFYDFDISKVTEVVSTCDYAVRGYIKGSFSTCERSRWPWRLYRESLS